MAFITRIAEGIVTMIFMLLVLYVILEGREEAAGPVILAGLDLFEILVMVFMFVIALYQRKVSILQSGNSTKLDTILKDLSQNLKDDVERSRRIGELENRVNGHDIRISNHEDRIKQLEEARG